MSVIVLVILFMYWVVLRTDRGLMEESKRRALDRKRNEWAWFEEDEDTGADKMRRRATSGLRDKKKDDVENLAPVMKPNFTYKMKIILGFFQITTNLALALDIPWPTHYQTFINAFTLVNFDFLSWSSVDCVRKVNFWTRFWVFTLTPLVLLVLVFVLYLLPRYIHHYRTMDDYDLQRAARERSSRQFWKLFLFTLFLIYPGVSSTTLRVFVCREIEGERYLLADFDIKCGTDTWKRMALYDIAFIFLYPIGIPAFFFYLLNTNKHRLALPEVRVQIGFLYEAYAADLWWFEVVDMMNKLFLTSLVAFFPYTAQLPVGMVFSVVYIQVLLALRPYIRSSDDRLHLFAQIEIFLMLMAGHMFLDGEEFDDEADILMSAILILVTVLVIVLFLYQCGRTLFKLFKLQKEEKKRREAEAAEAERARNENEANDTTGLRLPRNASMTRNPIYQPSHRALPAMALLEDEKAQQDKAAAGAAADDDIEMANFDASGEAAHAPMGGEDDAPMPPGRALPEDDAGGERIDRRARFAEQEEKSTDNLLGLRGASSDALVVENAPEGKDDPSKVANGADGGVAKDVDLAFMRKLSQRRGSERLLRASGMAAGKAAPAERAPPPQAPPPEQREPEMQQRAELLQDEGDRPRRQLGGNDDEDNPNGDRDLFKMDLAPRRAQRRSD
jgi:uncharacterized membrane protein